MLGRTASRVATTERGNAVLSHCEFRPKPLRQAIADAFLKAGQTSPGGED